MWHYFWAHMVYHFTRLCPKNRTRKCPLVILLMLLTIPTLAPQLYVIFFRLFYITVCPFPLHSIMVASVIFTFIMIGFSFLFAVMDPVDNSIKYVFHGFGVADLIFQIIFAVYTFSSFNCLQEPFLSSVYIIYLTLTAASLFSVLCHMFLRVHDPRPTGDSYLSHVHLHNVTFHQKETKSYHCIALPHHSPMCRASDNCNIWIFLPYLRASTLNPN